MTPDQQKLIDAAAEALYEAWRQGVIDTHEDTPFAWPDISEAIRDSYRRLVTIPVTVALRAAAEVAKNSVHQECCGNLLDDGTSPPECCGSPTVTPMYPHEVAAAISSLIPAQEKTSDA